ncbi:LacI family DNA-binding transcriptional regulator, partial [Carnobacterium sp.]
MVTINDIARLAGVAKSTVSRYLNGGSVSAKTKAKIDKIVAETGYKPNTFAQSLKAKNTAMIGT